MLLYLSELGIRHRLDGPISDFKSVVVLSRAIAQNSHKFEAIPQNPNRRLTEGSVACGKNKNQLAGKNWTIRKWKWSDVVVKYIQCESSIKIYTMQ